MGIKLAEYSSKSNAGKSYTVQQGSDGVIYCDCWGWKKHRTCWHLEDYHSLNNQPRVFPTAIEALKNQLLKKGKEEDDPLEVQIAKEVSKLSGGR